jgi:hypothetical protein
MEIFLSFHIWLGITTAPPGRSRHFPWIHWALASLNTHRGHVPTLSPPPQPGLQLSPLSENTNLYLPMLSPHLQSQSSYKLSTNPLGTQSLRNKTDVLSMQTCVVGFVSGQCLEDRVVIPERRNYRGWRL